MPIRRRKKNEGQPEIDQIKDLVVDVEGVKKAIEACIDFEQTTKIHLIDQQGRIEFSKLYKRKEKENRVREMVIDTVRDEVQRQLSPIDLKINQLLRITANRENNSMEKKHPTAEIDRVLSKNETKAY